MMKMNNFTKMLMLAAACCAVNVLSSCSVKVSSSRTKAETYGHVTDVVRTELLRTSQSWDGMELPEYPKGSPEIVAMKYVIPAGKKLGWHHHVAHNHGVMAQGELTIIGLDGKTKVLRKGDVVVEMVDAVHYGENRGTEPVVLYMFYVTRKEQPLSVPNPEIPMK